MYTHRMIFRFKRYIKLTHNKCLVYLFFTTTLDTHYKFIYLSVMPFELNKTQHAATWIWNHYFRQLIKIVNHFEYAILVRLKFYQVPANESLIQFKKIPSVNYIVYNKYIYIYIYCIHTFITKYHATFILKYC